jgi:hypothetical protein
MDLGTAPLFDLTAAAVQEVVEAAAPTTRTRSQELLAEIRDHRAVVAEREIATVRAVAEWAAEHVVAEDSGDASTLTERGWDTGLPVAGPGAPLISDFAVMELSALLGRSYDSGRNYVGQVVELAYRLPKNWGRVLAGEVPVWKALRIADHTRLLPEDAASFVDRQLAPYAAGCSWAQIDRLVETALIRSTPRPRRRSARTPPRPAASTSASPTSTPPPASPTAPPPSISPTPSTSNTPSPAAPSCSASSATTASTSAVPRRSVSSPGRT